MRVVTIRAAHARAVHAALQERAPLVDLALHLSVRVVAPGRKQIGLERVQERIARQKASLSGVRRLWHGAQTSTSTPSWVCGVGLPVADGSHGSDGSSARANGGGVAGLGRSNVLGTRTVARLAADGQLRPARVEAIGCDIVATLDPGRVAIRAHVIPVLRGAREEQRIAGRDPSPTRRHGTSDCRLASAPAAVPHHAERLQLAAFGRDHVLLERPDTGNVSDWESSVFPPATGVVTNGAPSCSENVVAPPSLEAK